jgi:hypothetical protein
MEEAVSESTLVAAGHASAVLATALGVALTVLGGVPHPAYELTVAWALLAVASNPVLNSPEPWERQQRTNTWHTGARIQRVLCYAGSALCFAASVFTISTGV